MDELLAETGRTEIHRERLLKLACSSKGTIRVATAYVTEWRSQAMRSCQADILID